MVSVCRRSSCVRGLVCVVCRGRFGEWKEKRRNPLRVTPSRSYGCRYGLWVMLLGMFGQYWREAPGRLKGLSRSSVSASRFALALFRLSLAASRRRVRAPGYLGQGIGAPSWSSLDILRQSYTKRGGDTRYLLALGSVGRLVQKLAERGGWGVCKGFNNTLFHLVRSCHFLTSVSLARARAAYCLTSSTRAHALSMLANVRAAAFSVKMSKSCAAYISKRAASAAL